MSTIPKTISKLPCNQNHIPYRRFIQPKRTPNQLLRKSTGPVLYPSSLACSVTLLLALSSACLFTAESLAYQGILALKATCTYEYRFCVVGSKMGQRWVKNGSKMCFIFCYLYELLRLCNSCLVSKNGSGNLKYENWQIKIFGPIL